jgi:hypothetical protein
MISVCMYCGAARGSSFDWDLMSYAICPKCSADSDDSRSRSHVERLVAEAKRHGVTLVEAKGDAEEPDSKIGRESSEVWCEHTGGSFRNT